MKSRIHQRSGLTLVEVMVTTLLVGLVLAASMHTVGSSIRARSITSNLQMGPALARNLLAEILQTAYTDPEDPNGSLGRDSGESGGSRADWDDVDDFHGWNSSSPVKSDGSALGYGAGWRRQVSVTYVSADTLTLSGSDTGLKLIKVTVTPPNGTATVVQALRSKHGAMEQLPFSDTTFVTGCQIAIQTNAAATDTVSGTRIKNHGTDQ